MPSVARQLVTGAVRVYDGDGRLERAAVCASLEGLHFTVWTGAVGAGRPRWRRYYYVGMDLEADCSEGELAPARP